MQKYGGNTSQRTEQTPPVQPQSSLGESLPSAKPRTVVPKRNTPNWSQQEDKLLVQAYYQVSLTNKGTDIPIQDFKQQVFQTLLFLGQQRNVPIVGRNQETAHVRVQKLKKMCMIWGQACASVRKASGETDQDLEAWRQERYKSLQASTSKVKNPKPFVFHQLYDLIKVKSKDTDYEVMQQLAEDGPVLPNTLGSTPGVDIDSHYGDGRNKERRLQREEQFTSYQVESSAERDETPDILKLKKSYAAPKRKKLKCEKHDLPSIKVEVAQGQKEVVSLLKGQAESATVASEAEAIKYKLEGLKTEMDALNAALDRANLSEYRRQRYEERVDELLFQMQDLNHVGSYKTDLQRRFLRRVKGYGLRVKFC